MWWFFSFFFILTLIIDFFSWNIIINYYTYYSHINIFVFNQRSLSYHFSTIFSLHLQYLVLCSTLNVRCYVVPFMCNEITFMNCCSSNVNGKTLAVLLKLQTPLLIVHHGACVAKVALAILRSTAMKD